MGLGAARRTVLITGAAGFLGSHLADRLLAEGYEVVGVDNLMTGNLGNLASAARDPHFHFEIGDVREPLKVYAEVIFNLACPASPQHYQSDPYATFTSSVLGALRIVEHTRLRPVRIIHASTSEVYGDPLEHPQTETYWGHVNPVGERACYDEGKRAAETVLMDARRLSGADVRIVRIFNTYGPRMALNDGRVVSNFIRQAIAGEPLTMYGDGSHSRSFCYVSDLIEGIVRLAEIDRLDFDPPIINLGNPHETTMQALADMVLKVAAATPAVRLRTSEDAVRAMPDPGMDIVNKPLPADDPKRRCPDITRARRFLAFVPKVSLEEGLRATYDDFCTRLGASVDLRTPSTGVLRTPAEPGLSVSHVAPRPLNKMQS